MHRHLSVAEPKEFDLYIHGSPEHVRKNRSCKYIAKFYTLA